MGRDCTTLYNRLANNIVEQRESHQSIVTSWIRTKIYFALLKWALLCLHGSRSLSRNVYSISDNVEVAHEIAKG